MHFTKPLLIALAAVASAQDVSSIVNSALSVSYETYTLTYLDDELCKANSVCSASLVGRQFGSADRVGR